MKKKSEKFVKWEERVFSTKFLNNMLNHVSCCFVPFEDYQYLVKCIKLYSNGKLSLAQLLFIANGNKEEHVAISKKELQKLVDSM